MQKTAKVSNGNKKPAPVVKTAQKKSSESSSESDSSADEVIHSIYTCGASVTVLKLAILQA